MYNGRYMDYIDKRLREQLVEAAMQQAERQLTEPVNPDCEPLRQQLQGIAEWFYRLEPIPQVDDENYDEMEEMLGGLLSEAHEAFEKKPPSCNMTQGDDDRYMCEQCNFYCHISTMPDDER